MTTTRRSRNSSCELFLVYSCVVCMTERDSALADEAKWRRLGRRCADLKRSRRVSHVRSVAPATTTTTAAARKLYFPSGRAPTVATKLFIAFGGPSSTGPGPAWLANPSRPVRCAPGRTALSDGRPVSRSGSGQRVSDPFGDGSSNLDYICHVASSQHQQRRMCRRSILIRL